MSCIKFFVVFLLLINSTAFAQTVRIGAKNQHDSDLVIGIKHNNDLQQKKTLKPNESFFLEVPDEGGEVTAVVKFNNKDYECQMFTRANSRSGDKLFLIKSLDEKNSQAKCAIRFMPRQ